MQQTSSVAAMATETKRLSREAVARLRAAEAVEERLSVIAELGPNVDRQEQARQIVHAVLATYRGSLLDAQLRDKAKDRQFTANLEAAGQPGPWPLEHRGLVGRITPDEPYGVNEVRS